MEQLPTNKSSLLDHALNLYEQGYSVIPLGDPSTPPPQWLVQRAGGDAAKAQEMWPKTPRGSWKPFQDDPADDDQIRLWWLQNPNANIGILTNNIVVIDADSAEAVEFVKQNITHTPRRVVTSKGMHFYYNVNPDLDIRNTANATTKIDVRGNGGYVVAPPSIHASGKKYEWQIDVGVVCNQPTDLPSPTEGDNLRIKCTVPVIQPMQNVAPPGTCNLNFDVSKVAPARTDAPAMPGERNNAAASLAGRYIKAGDSIQEVMQKMQLWNNTNPVPLDQIELETTISSVARTHASNTGKPVRIKPVTNFNWLEDLEVSEEEAKEYDDPNWIYKDLIINGHLVVIVAPPNGGKTTIMMHIAGVMTNQGIQVVYVNADVGQSDAKSMVTQAKRNGFRLLLPDMKAGKSMDDVIENLTDMNRNSNDFKGWVFIFDTLKKMTDVINKSRSKELYKLLRSLTAKGMTIVALAHTNKYDDSEGNPIYEGTADLRSDFDDLIYLIPKKNDDGSMTVSTKVDKKRGNIEQISFTISKEREVSQVDSYIDVEAIKIEHEQKEKDIPIIGVITEAISEGEFTETKIISYAKEKGTGIGWRTITSALKRYTGNHWNIERTMQNNAKQYFLIDLQDVERTPHP